MNSIRIEKSQNIESVERRLAELNQLAPKCELQIPYSIEDYRLGGKGALIQMLMTWAELCPDAAIQTHVQKEADINSTASQLTKLFDQEYGFVLALVSRKFWLESSRYFRKTSGDKLNSSLMEELLQDHSISQGEILQKGLRFFMAVDQVINDANNIGNPFIQLYSRRALGSFPMRRSVSRLLNDLFGRAERLRARRHMPSPEILKNLIELISRVAYELFENAERWGVTKGRNSVRGLSAEIHLRQTVNHKAMWQQVGYDNPIAMYLRNFLGEDGYETSPFLELTIFDNGPGLAKHYLQRAPKNIAEELSATRKCLLLGSGRSPMANEGRGLYETFKLLGRSGGFIRYRSNELSVYRDFCKDTVDFNKLKSWENDNSDASRKAIFKELYLRDWVDGVCSPRRHPHAVGSLFTIILPISELPNEPGLLF